MFKIFSTFPILLFHKVV